MFTSHPIITVLATGLLTASVLSQLFHVHHFIKSSQWFYELLIFIPFSLMRKIKHREVREFT